MFLIRDVMYCKPGKARPMVEKFLALSKLGSKVGLDSVRVMTDVSAERFWTIVAEFEVANLDEFTQTSKKMMDNPDFQQVMKGYHDLVDHGRREIYTIER